ncbi:MAG TPA: zinc ribbon domain-containing protein [Candidatus Sulfotelmatobacter sp.]
MAFCNSCGATLTAGTRFCNKCGAAVLASTPVSSSLSAAPVPAAPGTVPVPGPPPTGQSNALKIVLIVVGVIVVAGMLGMAAIGFIGWRIARHTHVRQEGDNVKVETPFGSVEANKDPQEAARNLGVEIYPGAEILKDGSSMANFGGVHTASVSFETGDPLKNVADFYKSKFPNAMVTTSGPDHCTIVSNASNNLITINIQGGGDKTNIQISTVSHKGGSSSSE